MSGIRLAGGDDGDGGGDDEEEEEDGIEKSFKEKIPAALSSSW